MSPFQVIEKLSLVAPLGLCFHDAATGERVIDGLTVEIYADTKNNLKKRFRAVPNPSGVFVIHKISGLEEFSRGAGDDAFWKENPPQKPFIVEVFDNENRFQPFRFSIKLPVRGIYRWENIPPTSPNKNLSSVPLYSAASRKKLSGMSLIRAQFRESFEKAASFAVLEARLNSKLIARGIADGEGRIVLMFPSLAPATNPLTSPPSNSTRVTLAEQKWNIDLTLKYQPAILQPEQTPDAENSAEILPDLRKILEQTQAKMFADVAKTENFTTAVLLFGRELILRSREAQTSPPSAETVYSSYLFVSPA